MNTDSSVWKKMEGHAGGVNRGELFTVGTGRSKGPLFPNLPIAHWPEVQDLARKVIANHPAQEETPEERARRMGVPYVKPHPVLPIMNGNPVVAVCGGCGRDVHYMEGYSCPQTDCPIQRRVTF